MLRISEKTKKEFDKVQAELIGKNQKKFSQDDTLKFLLRLFKNYQR